MVIGPNGEQMGTKKLADALTIANYAGLDLVLMNGTPGHAVGKIMDYNRYRYERQKKQKEAMKIVQLQKLFIIFDGVKYDFSR